LLNMYLIFFVQYSECSLNLDVSNDLT